LKVTSFDGDRRFCKCRSRYHVINKWHLLYRPKSTEIYILSLDQFYLQLFVFLVYLHGKSCSVSGSRFGIFATINNMNFSPDCCNTYNSTMQVALPRLI
jgi:hypothetical protein